VYPSGTYYLHSDLLRAESKRFANSLEGNFTEAEERNVNVGSTSAIGTRAQARWSLKQCCDSLSGQGSAEIGAQLRATTPLPPLPDSHIFFVFRHEELVYDR
jgi:hypothetical protein